MTDYGALADALRPKPPIRLFLLLMTLVGAEAGLAVAYRGSLIASACVVSAGCFAIVANRLWDALSE